MRKTEDPMPGERTRLLQSPTAIHGQTRGRKFIGRKKAAAAMDAISTSSSSSLEQVRATATYNSNIAYLWSNSTCSTSKVLMITVVFYYLFFRQISSLLTVGEKLKKVICA